MTELVHHMETLDERNIKNKSIVRLSHVVLGCGEMVQFPADKVRELCQGQYQNIVKLHGHVKSQGPCYAGKISNVMFRLAVVCILYGTHNDTDTFLAAHQIML